jgi:dTDP-4-amino-4,6-dideoxy-D-galactose acyltransferase
MTDLFIKKLSWDSDFFGIQIGSIDFKNIDFNSFKQVLDLAKAENFKLVYGFQDSKFDYDNDIIAKLNGRLIDKKVIFSLDVNSKKIDDNNQIEVHQAHLPNQDLYELAILSGEYSRFKKDLIFGKDNFEKLYKLWIENSVNGKIADKVFVHKSFNDEINGMITLKIDENSANIGLLSVKPNFQGQKIGQRLVDKSLLYCQKKQIKSLTVPTQLYNQNACNFYKKYGFQVEKIVNTFHFYL